MLSHVADYDEARSVVAEVMAAAPSGSYLILWDGTTTSEGLVNANAGYEKSGGVSYIPRSIEEITRYFDGLELLGPGIESVSLWRQNVAEVGTAAAVDGYGGVARKP